MCMVSINIDEAALRDMRPDLDSAAAIRLWAQELVDARMQQMRMEGQELVGNRTTKDVYDAIEERVKNRGFSDLPFAADHAIDVETMRSRLHRMVHEVYSMP